MHTFAATNTGGLLLLDWFLWLVPSPPYQPISFLTDIASSLLLAFLSFMYCNGTTRGHSPKRVSGDTFVAAAILFHDFLYGQQSDVVLVGLFEVLGVPDLSITVASMFTAERLSNGLPTRVKSLLPTRSTFSSLILVPTEG